MKRLFVDYNEIEQAGVGALCVDGPGMLGEVVETYDFDGNTCLGVVKAVRVGSDIGVVVKLQMSTFTDASIKKK